ncbi:hypothetical protein JCM3774_000279 [Rhodotorula dairenensis]
MSSSSSTGSALPHVEPYSQGKAVIRNVSPMQEGKWVELRRVDWTDEDGNDRVWEMAARKTTAKAGIDAVAIAAILKRPNAPAAAATIPIILQYRPPIQNICVELPAGLIDASESPEQSGIRELYEETGYGGDDFEGRVKVLEVGSTIVSDPGLSAANMSLVTLEVDLKEGEHEPKPHLDEGEHIDVRLVPVLELYAHLQAFEKLGYTVDARLHHYAAGIEIAKKLTTSSGAQL